MHASVCAGAERSRTSSRLSVPVAVACIPPNCIVACTAATRSDAWICTISRDDTVESVACALRSVRRTLCSTFSAAGASISPLLPADEPPAPWGPGGPRSELRFIGPRLASAAKRPVAVGLDAMPLGSSLSDATNWPSVQGPVDFLQPIADLQQRTRCDLVPLGVQAEVMGAVQRSGGIAALSEQQRNQYVDDVGAFVRYPKQTAAFDVWAERVVARTYKKRYEGLEGAPRYEDYFASSILYDEAVASLAARYCRAHPSTLLVCVVSDDHVKFGCSAQGRFQRLEKDPDGAAGFFRAPSILLNPSAESTGSLSRSLRLALAVDPAKARTCSDCVWFSRSPPPSLLTHMMNPVDGAAFKIDLGLSMPTV